MLSKNSKSSVKPKRPSKPKRGRNKNVAKTKVVVRRLPPLIPECLFFESVKQWVNEETCTWSRFHQGRISKSKNKESIFSRAYFHFKTVEQVLDFHRGYDNHLFIDRQGNENRAVVEFAIYQKLPKEHKKPDPRQGTIETDPDYLAFLESLKVEEIQQTTAKEPGVVSESGTTQLERLEARLANAAINAANVVEKPTTTPLLEHLRALKLGSKSKSPPLKQAQIAILSPSAKGTGSRAAKQSSQQTRATQANEFPQSTNKPRRERERRKKERERERERERREKEKREKDKKYEENNKSIEKEKEKESEVVDEKLKEKTKEQGKEKENYREKEREKRREKKSERERQKLIREREKKAQATETSRSELPAITIVPRPQTEESKAEAKEKEKEKETKRAPVKITIQQRQKEQIRQFIQKTNPSLPKKELNTTENDSKETSHKESVVKESTVTVQKDARKEEKDTTEPSVTSSSAHTSTSTSNVPSNRRRERSRKHSTDVKTPVQIQILTKPPTQSINTPESNVSTTSSAALSSSSSTATTNTPTPVRRTGRGYFGKRGGRW
ncbi:Smg-4/UPF3 family-domain-containing protein [Glomus cerebriforme]|uniref:Smg-4/UPF3 family-domain-containing protein n=1 Tax=Glomus cerebriforme TaxID=658196 RepID=A0A397TCT7_9GLOM|nr:Smg-4/UPF3 family-domain-containing protein [Glomus cerebriforme]